MRHSMEDLKDELACIQRETSWDMHEEAGVIGIYASSLDSGYKVKCTRVAKVASGLFVVREDVLEGLGLELKILPRLKPTA